MKKFKKKLPKKIKHLQHKIPFKKGKLEDDNPLRITNETVAEHREKVLGRARKYIYPLQHSKHKIVLISSSLFVVAVVGFFTYCTLALYKFKSSSDFLYGVTQVIPFPVAKAGSRFVSYENYLFELRHYMHYYETQQKLNFDDNLGKQQLEDYKKRALEKVINDAYVKQLADKNNVSVSNQELDTQIALMRSQNRLGANEKGFEDVLRDNFGWTVNDFRRELKTQMLAQEVVAALDTPTNERAQTAYAEIQAGADFAAIVQKYSDQESTKASGGDYGFLIDRSSRDVPAQVTEALFKLEAGQVSQIINTGFSLEIVKNLEIQGEKRRAAHVSFNFRDISTYVNELRDTSRPRSYISL
ncbi:MAG: SurA N-terminal domain-containing protein [Candidatus Saccharibacteria bacterium]|nr:SurA N-terminal domain-containing protein [Candidatus Saccharibacteria bacterium]